MGNDKQSWLEWTKQWDASAESAAKEHPLRLLKTLPKMEGITCGAAKNLKWKATRYMMAHDKDRKILRHFLRHPLRYGWRFAKSLFQKNRYKRQGDLFLYNVDSVDTFRKKLENPNSLLVVGFSYCHKPHECPSGRFTTECIHDPTHPVCRQCFIGKAVNALPEERVIPLFITTIHYIGEKIFETVHAHPDQEILFIITACELTLEMFSDWGNMVDIRGIGVRLDGRICNTMRAFELSEEGTKPGLTVVLDDTQQQILDLIRHRNEADEKASSIPPETV
jgi:hypothetical protein